MVLDLPIQYQYHTNTNTTNTTNTNETLWFSTAIFPMGGQIIKYDIPSGSLTIHDVTYTHSVPSSVIAEDEKGMLWANRSYCKSFLLVRSQYSVR